jgi:hypothetical protein
MRAKPKAITLIVAFFAAIILGVAAVYFSSQNDSYDAIWCLAGFLAALALMGWLLWTSTDGGG